MTDQEKDMLKKAVILFVCLLLFAGISIPIYFLMLAGVKEGDTSADKQTVTEAVVYEVDNRVDLTAPADDAAPEDGQDGEVIGEDGAAGEGEEMSVEEFSAEPESEAVPAGFESPETDPMLIMPSANPEDLRIEQLTQTGFKLNGFAFFGGIVLAMVLYAIYFELVLKKQFYPLMQQEKGALLFALIPFLMFTIIEGVELTLVPLKVTEGYAHFAGLPWEVAYVLIVYFIFYTLIGTWLDTNMNRVMDLDGSRFCYNKFGNGPRNLIVIPGLSLMTVEGKGLSMAWMFRSFMKDYTVYVMDKKDNVPKDATIEDLAEDIAKAMDKCGIVTADVYGVSMGGMIAQYLTLNHPDLVDKLVLCVTASKMNDTIENYTNHNIMLAKKGDLETVQREGITELFTEEYIKPMKAFLPLLSKMGIPKSNTRFIRLCQAIQTVDAYDRLGEIKCPTYVIGAGRDKVVGTESADELADAIEGSEKFIYRNLGHGAYQEAKDIHERILRFLHKPVRMKKEED
jgi:pimeloyl-ACP methyl ester carboxylesterase